METPRTWTLWAHNFGPRPKFPDGLFMHIGSKRYVELHGMKEPIVEVLLTEDPNGPYYGWLETGKETPHFIWPSEGQLDMCFPYGLKAEEEHGKGVPLRFSIQKK